MHIATWYPIMTDTYVKVEKYITKVIFKPKKNVCFG